MANKPISMSKVRQILKLYSQRIGKKKIANRLGMSKNTVKVYIDLYLKMKVPLEELSALDDFELNKMFHPPRTVSANERLSAVFDFYEEMQKTLRRRGATIGQQYVKYRQKHPDGFGITNFYMYYRQWKMKINPTMHIEHKAGDMSYIDFAGETLPYVDADTGEMKDAQVFVSILGWSQYTYIEAVPSQRVEDLIGACENTLHYYKGVPLAIVPDNLKSAVYKSHRHEPQINENFKAFADHYGTAVIPARRRKPRDKAHVENMVKIAYQKIYTRLSPEEVLTLEELNRQLHHHLASLNDGLLTGKKSSRTDQWMMELSSLAPLPADRYEMRKIKLATVMKNAHVILGEDKHYYSVPYQLIGKKLRLQYSKSQVEIYNEYELVALHKRVRSAHNYSTEPSHMPPQHQVMMQWNPEFFIKQAREIDPVVEFYIARVLEKKRHPEQAYKSCAGILSFAKRVGKDRLIKACNRAHEIGYYNYKIVEDILKRHIDRFDDDPEPTLMPEHDNIRGANYYQ